MVFTDAAAAAMAYYGLHHVLVSYDLTDEQRALLTSFISGARRCALAGGVVLFPPMLDLPVAE